MSSNQYLDSAESSHSQKMQSITKTPISLQLGQDYGCALMQSDVIHAQMIDSQLRALDLSDCPNLQSIDLSSSSQKEIHLSVIGCPQLQDIFLPERSCAYLHIDFGDQRPVIHVYGGVTHIDVAWKNGRFETTSGEGNSWSFAVLGSIDELRNSQSPVSGNGLWALTQSLNKSQVDLVVPDSVGAVLISEFKNVEHCRIYNNSVVSLDIRNAPHLEHIEMFGSCADISLTACSSLRFIDGPHELKQSTKLSLHNGSGASAGLRLNLPFTEVMIADSTISRLVMSEAKSLRLFRCYALYKLNVPNGCAVECTSFTPPQLIGIATTIFDEATLTHELDRIKAGDVSAWPVLRALLPLASSEKLVPRVLKGLEVAMSLGVSIEEIWKTRLELYAQHKKVSQNRKLKPLSEQQLLLGTKEWAWSMATDLSYDGWRADWRIWSHAAEADIKGVRKMLPVMADGITKSVQASSALFSFLLNQAGPNGINFLIAVFSKLAKNSSDGNEYALKTAHHCATLGREVPELSLLVKSAKDFICNALDLQELIVVLERWLRDDPVGTRVRLAQLGANPPRKGTRAMSIARFKQLTQTLLLGGRLVNATQPRPLPRTRP